VSRCALHAERARAWLRDLRERLLAFDPPQHAIADTQSNLTEEGGLSCCVAASEAGLSRKSAWRFHAAGPAESPSGCLMFVPNYSAPIN